MKDAALLASPLFRGATSEEIAAMLPCLGASPRRFARGERILRAGEPTRYMGLVLTGSVLTEHTDMQGAVTLLGPAEPGDIVGLARSGEVFAEAYACAPDELLLVDVVASEACEVLFLDAKRILTQCTNACEHHSRIIRNLVRTLAQKNLALSRRSLHTGPRTIRARLLSYLGEQAQRAGSRSFTIPFDRQQLADYLNVERSALSNELSKMQRDGLLTCRRSSFCLLCEF